jgi:phage gp29-like protein
MQLFDRMADRDDRLQGVLETRRLAVTGIDRDILPRYSEDARAEKSAEVVKEMVKTLDFDDLLSGLLDGVPKGLAAYELIWEGSTIVAVQEVPQRMMKWEDGILMIDVGTSGAKADYQPIETNKFVVFSPRTKPGAKDRRGILRSLSMLWVAKHYAMKDWAAFVEVFGMPLRLGVYPEGMLEDDKAELYEALQDLGSDAAAIIPENMRIEFPKVMSTTGGNLTPMKEIVDYVDTCYAIRLLGQNLTTESQSGSGTLAGGAHENVRKDYLRQDAKSVGAVIEEDLFRPIVGFNLGWDYPVPRMWFDVEDAQDDEARAKVYVEMGKTGMEFSKAQIREEFNFAEPIDEEDTLSSSSSEPSPFDAINNPTPPVEAGVRTSGSFSVADDLNPNRGEGDLSSGARASKSITEDTIRQAQDEHINLIFDFVAKLAADVDTPEQLRRRLRLAAPDLDAALEATGLSLDDVEDVYSRAFHTSFYNGGTAVENELEYQKNTGMVEE